MLQESFRFYWFCLQMFFFLHLIHVRAQEKHGLNFDYRLWDKQDNAAPQLFVVSLFTRKTIY